MSSFLILDIRDLKTLSRKSLSLRVRPKRRLSYTKSNTLSRLLGVSLLVALRIVRILSENLIRLSKSATIGFTDI